MGSTSIYVHGCVQLREERRDYKHDTKAGERSMTNIDGIRAQNPNASCFSPRSAHRYLSFWYAASSLILSITVQFLAPARLQASQYVEVTADFDLLSYKPANLSEGTSPHIEHVTFKCIAGTNDWRVDVLRPSGAMDLWWFDGTTLYENMLVPKQSVQPIGVPPHGGNAVRDAATEAAETMSKTNFQDLGSGVHLWQSVDGCPLGGYCVNIPWLTFCSGPYLKRKARVVPLPVMDLRHAPDGFAYADKTSCFPDELGLPKSIELYASDSLFKASVNSEVFQGKHDVNLWKRGSMGFKWDFPDGMLRFRYSVLESTNLLGWNIPVRFQWDLNVPKTRKQVPLVIGKAHAVRPCGPPTSVILPQLHPTVIDWRFETADKSIRGLIYKLPSPQALPTNDVLLQSLWAARLKDAHFINSSKLLTPGSRPRPRRWIIGATFAVAALSILAIVILFSIRSSNKTK